MNKPVRIQRKRTKGYNMQEHSRSINGLDCVYVGRPSKWGNPFIVGKTVGDRWGNFHEVKTSKQACELFIYEYRNDLLLTFPNYIKYLKGKNRSCWCSLDQPCHADVLLELANENQ